MIYERARILLYHNDYEPAPADSQEIKSFEHFVAVLTFVSATILTTLATLSNVNSFDKFIELFAAPLLFILSGAFIGFIRGSTTIVCVFSTMAIVMTLFMVQITGGV